MDNKQNSEIQKDVVQGTQYTFDAAVGKVLRLVIRSIYTNEDIFLRELVSNASDACDKLRYKAITSPELIVDSFKIRVEIDKEHGDLIVRDNGVGMNEEDLRADIGTIANSGTQNFLDAVTKAESCGSDASASIPQLIGQFGVGFYSVFIVADYVTIYSTKYDSEKTYIWSSDGREDYTIAEHSEKLPTGTIIKLHINSSKTEYLDMHRVRHIISTYSDHIGFPVELVEGDKVEIVNSGSALWIKPPSEITEKEYEEFYHHIAHSPDTPMMILHNRVEGYPEYTSLLYIPTNKPFDLFHPDRKARIKLYIKRVFITDENLELIPQYMRFLRGIVDSADLPLNISRETLQHNFILSKVKKSIVKKVLKALKKKAKNEEEEFQKFWLNFGEVLKEGLCEQASEEREELLDVCRFFSLNAGEKLISLDHYIENMLPSQTCIYYLIGDKIEEMRVNPQLEGFLSRGIDVMLLKDHVDSFWTNVVTYYKGKEMRAVNTAGIDLDAIKALESGDEAGLRDESLLQQNKSAVDVASQKLVIDYVKKILHSRVADVRISTKLLNSPACLAIAEGAMNVKMENILLEQKQLHRRSAKILELNFGHKIIKQIAASVAKIGTLELKCGNADIIGVDKDKETLDSVSDMATSLVNIIFHEACIVAGEPIQDVSEFTSILNKTLEMLCQ